MILPTTTRMRVRVLMCRMVSLSCRQLLQIGSAPLARGKRF